MIQATKKKYILGHKPSKKFVVSSMRPLTDNPLDAFPFDSVAAANHYLNSLVPEKRVGIKLYELIVIVNVEEVK